MPDEVLTFNHFPDLIKALKQAQQDALQAACDAIGQPADATCPVDVGFLRASRYTQTAQGSTYGQAVSAAKGLASDREVLPERDAPAPDEGVVAYAASYAIYVHDGTRHVGARPWLAEAAHSADVGRVMRTIIDDALSRA